MKRYRRNELQAREGIDTFKWVSGFTIPISGRNELQAREGIDTSTLLFQIVIPLCNVEMSYKPERALTRQHCVKRQVIHIWGRNELQAREGIDTYHHDRFRQILYPGSRNELQAREGIDTL